MPYNPGIQDISGQLIAQGMSQAGAARAQAIQSIGQSITGGIKQYQQNQFLTKQALGKFSGQMADPNFADFVRKAMADDPNTPISAELKTALKNVSAGKSDVYDAGVLAAFTDAYQDNMRGQLMQAQIDRAKFETDQARANMRRQSLLSQMLGLSQEEPTGMPAAASAVAVPGAQPSMPRAAAPAAAPAEQPAEAPAPARAAAVPSMAPPLALSAQPQRTAAPSAAPAGAAAVPPNVQSFINRPLGAFSPEIANAARREVLMKFLSKGEVSDPTLVAQRLAVEQRKQQAEEREMTFDEANNAAKTFNTSQLELPYGQRRFASVEPTTRPGFSALKIGLAEMTQAEKEASAAQTEDEKLRLGRINTNIIEDRKSSSTDRLLAPAVANLKSMIGKGDLEEGSLAQLRASARSLAKSFGLPVDEAALGSAQTANAFFGQVLIPLFISTKGSTSDRDAQLFASWSPQLGLNDEANLQMLDVIQRRVELGRSLEKLANQYDAGKIKSADYVERRGKLIEDYDSKIPTVDEFRQKAGLPERTIAETVTKPVVPRGALDTAINAATQQGASAASNMFNDLMSKGKKPPTK
jgi:hypothetical protein